MASLEWRQDFSIGIPGVDHEHRELIEAINRVLQAMSPDIAPAQIDTEAVKAGLGAIHGQVAAHFALEEKEMRDRQYHDYAHHKDDHEALLDTFVDILVDVETRPLDELAAELRPRLSDWFGRHFREEDAKLHKFLADGAQPK